MLYSELGPRKSQGAPAPTCCAYVNINKLDFVISLSSGTIWGDVGQTNYTT